MDPTYHKEGVPDHLDHDHDIQKYNDDHMGVTYHIYECIGHEEIVIIQHDSEYLEVKMSDRKGKTTHVGR